MVAALTVFSLPAWGDASDSMEDVRPGQGSSDIRDHAPGYFTPKRNPDGSKKMSTGHTYGSFYGPGPGSPTDGNATYGSYVHVSGQHQ